MKAREKDIRLLEDYKNEMEWITGEMDRMREEKKAAEKRAEESR